MENVTPRQVSWYNKYRRYASAQMTLKGNAERRSDRDDVSSATPTPQRSYSRSLRMVSRYEEVVKPSSVERNKRLETESEIVDLELEKQMKVKPYPFAVATWECFRFSTERGNEIEALDIDPTETKVITAGQDASIRLYDLKTRKVVTTYYGYNKDCNKTFVRPWNTGTMGGEGHYLRVYAAKFSTSKEQLFITGGLDGILKILVQDKIWANPVCQYRDTDIFRSRKTRRFYKFNLGTNPTRHEFWASTVLPYREITGRADENRLWDVRSPTSCRSIVGPMVCGDTIDSMDNTIAVGQWTKEGKIMLLDMRTDGYRVLKPLNRWHGGGFPYSLSYFKDAMESGGSFKDDLLLVGGSGYLEVVSIREEEILRGFPDKGHIVSIDNHKNLIFTASTEHAFNLHEYFPNIFRGDSDDTLEGSEPKAASKELRDSPEVPHARIKDINKIKRAKAPEDSLIKQIKRLMAKSCRKADLTKEERAELTKKPEEDGDISESSLKNIPLTAKKSVKVKSILVDRIADKQMRKLIKKIRKKELSRVDQKSMKKELMRIQGHVIPKDDVSEESVVYI